MTIENCDRLDWLYHLKEITTFENKTALTLKQNHHGILLCTDSQAELSTSTTHHPTGNKQIVLVDAHFEKANQIEFTRSTSGYFVQFLVLKEEENGIYHPAPFPLSIVDVDSWLAVEKVKEMKRRLLDSSYQGLLQANALFQEWLLLLCDNQTKGQSVNEVIESSKVYIDTHYQRELTREVLAQRAGLHVDYYSRKFKQLYKMSPIAYVNNVRMKQAKKLLLESKAGVNMIARKVGFNDEFYFSRKFKQQEGFSPTVYVNTIKRSTKIASLNHLVTGHLLALNLEPYAAIINSSFPAVNRLSQTLSLGEDGPDLEKLLATKPELILRSGSTTAPKSRKEDLYAQIAPTITLDFEENWRVHLERIAVLIGREQESERFLQRYMEKATSVSQRIKERIGSGTVLVVGVGEDNQCVYGTRNIGTVIYGDLQLQAPAGIERIAHYQEVSLADIAAYEPDYILLTVYRKNNRIPNSETIRKQIATFNQDRTWQSLEAVQRQRVYPIFAEKHLYTSYNALSHDLMLTKMAQLIQ